METIASKCSLLLWQQAVSNLVIPIAERNSEMCWEIAVSASWWKDNIPVTSDEPSQCSLEAEEPTLSKQMQSEIA